MTLESFNWFLERTVEYVLQPVSSWENLTASFAEYLRDWTGLARGTGWLYWITSYLLALGVFVHARRKGEAPSGQSFLQFAFPREVWQHPSAILDYKYVAFHRGMAVLVYAPFVSGGIALLAKGVAHLMPSGLSADYLIGEPFGYVLFTLILFMAIDFGLFFAHYLYHKIPFLWHFHKVHHSAEVLTPITDYRAHPIEYFFYSAAQVVTAQLVTGVYVVLTQETAHFMTLFYVNVFAVLYFMCGYELRHSHIWLSYGPILSYIFISPAQHQIHHSTDRNHFDKNFGSTFAIWDWMFGCLYVPQRREQLRFGLPDENAKEYSSIANLYFLPVKKAWERFLPGLPPTGERNKSSLPSSLPYP